MNAFQLILKEIDERRDMLAKALMQGAAKDYAEYRGMCGEIKGLSEAHNFIAEIVKKLEQDDD